MKVVCIDDYTLSGIKIFGLTVGKIYDAEEKNLEFNSPSKTYRIVDDNGLINWYNDEVLMPLEKYRELQLKDLGI